MARSNRLHKKLHTGPYQDMGFEVHFQVDKNWNDPDMDKIYDAFVSEAIEDNGLSCGGGASEEAGGFFAHFFVDKIREQKKCSWKFVHESATEGDRERVEQWLKNQKDIVWFEVGPLFDAWYD